MDKQHDHLVTFDVLLSLFSRLNLPVSSTNSFEERAHWVDVLNRWIDNPEVFASTSVEQAAITHRDLWYPVKVQA